MIFFVISNKNTPILKQIWYILPILIAQKSFSQDETRVPDIEYGFSHGVFSSITTINPALKQIPEGREMKQKNTYYPLAQVNFGFNYGFFLLTKMTDRVFIRPELNTSFSNYHYTSNATDYKRVNATSIDISVFNQVIYTLKPINTHGIIKAAKCMSYYLTAKQPYLIFGPKFSFRKYDKGFLHKGYVNEGSFGMLVGFGVNYGFHNMNFSPEIKYSVEAAQQNKYPLSQKITHSIILTMNLF